MSRLVLLATHYPRTILVGVLVLTLVAIAGLVDPLTGEARLRIDPSFEKLLPEDDPARRAYDDMQARFEVGESLVVALEPPGGVFDVSALEAIARVEASFLEIDEVKSVRSIASALLPPSAQANAEDSSVLEAIRAAPERSREIERRVLASPLYRGVLVSPDAGLAALLVSLEPMEESVLLEAGLGRRLETRAQEAVPGWPVWIAGAPFLKAEMNRILNAELVSQVPLVLLIMMVVSFSVFRSKTGAWLPVATIGLALVWTLGAMGWAGRPLNIVTSIVPPLILVVGFAYTIHVVAEAQALARRGARRAGSDLAAIAFPIALTAVTTAAGFVSLGTSTHQAIREFGAFGAAGVLASLLASLTFTPAVLALSPIAPASQAEAFERRLDRVFDGLASFALGNRVWILAGAAILFVAALVAATGIQVDTRIVDNFRGESLVRQSYERLNESLDGSDLLYVLLEGAERGSLLEPESLREVSRLQAWLADQPEIGGTTSIVDYLEASRIVLGASSPLAEGATRSLVAQLLWLSDGELIDPILDRRQQATLVVVRSRASSSSEISELVGRIERHLAAGTGLSGTVTGGSVLLTRAVDDVSRDQARSLCLAFGIILAILTVAFRSLGFAFLTLLLNALPVAAYFGALGVTGVPLNNATALLGCVVLGIAIDDTLHFVSRHRECARSAASASEAARAALAHVGRPVTWTTAALCLGLLVLTSSDLATQAQFGALGAGTLFFAWLVDVLVTPALCSYLEWPQEAEAADGAVRALRPRAFSLGADHPGRDGHAVQQSLGSGSQ